MDRRCIVFFVKNWVVSVAIVVACIFFWGVNDASPLRCDDLVYQFMWLKGGNGAYPADINNRIDSFYEAIISQINHYQVMNGRFTVHFIVQCFCGFWGKSMFNIINAIVYALFLLGSILLLKLDTLLENLFLIFMLWLLLPIQYIFTFDISFAVNYLWVATACIYFIILFEKALLLSTSHTWWKLALLFLYSLMCGSSQEGFTIPLSASVLIYTIINFKKLNTNSFYLILGLWVGTALVVFAPGTLKRGNSVVADFDMSAFIHTKIQVLMYSKRFLFFILLLFLTYINKGKQYVVNFMCEHFLMIGLIVFNLLFVLAFPRYNQRLEFPLELMSVLLAVHLIIMSKLWKRLRLILCPFIIVVALVHMAFTVHYARLVGNEYKEMIEEYRLSSQGETHYRDFHIPKPFSSYVIRFGGSVEEAFVSFTMNKKVVVIKKDGEEATRSTR